MCKYTESKPTYHIRTWQNDYPLRNCNQNNMYYCYSDNFVLLCVEMGKCFHDKLLLAIIVPYVYNGTALSFRIHIQFPAWSVQRPRALLQQQTPTNVHNGLNSESDVAIHKVLKTSLNL